MAKEIEAKIRVPDLQAIHERFLELGALDSGLVFERNWVLDTEAGSLRARGVLLRVRSNGDVGGVVTVKHTVNEEGGKFKMREEVEAMTDSTDDTLMQMEILGYGVRWVYEKRRRTMLWRDCVIALDECPEIGCFIEIEGQPHCIHEVAVAAGLNPDDHIDDSYLGLWEKHLADRNEQHRHMAFAHADTRRKSEPGQFTIHRAPKAET